MSIFGIPSYEDFEKKSSEELRRIRIDHKMGLAGTRESLKYLPPSSFLGHWGALAAIKRFEKELGWIDSILFERESKGKLTSTLCEEKIEFVKLGE